jgi:hypothetical protein
VLFVGQERMTLLTDYVNGVERKEIIAPRLSLPYNEHRYASTEDVFKTGDNHHLPDTISSMALAYRAGLKRPGLAFASA